MGRGVHRGFITYEELNKSLGKRNLSSENLSQAFVHILDGKITLVEKKSDYKVLRKKDSGSKEEGKTIEKSDDPIRMYLREMGGVELLSREGEIAIAKRIEEGARELLFACCFYPGIVDRILDEYQEVVAEDKRLSEVLVGFMDIEEGIPPPALAQKKEKEDKGEPDRNTKSAGDPLSSSTLIVHFSLLFSIV